MLITCLLFLLSTPGAYTLSVLVLHPFYASSHVLALQSVASRLLSQGHHVTTIRYLDTHNLVLPPHPNHTQLNRALDNSNNTFSFLSQEARAKFDLPSDLLWSRGLNFISIQQIFYPMLKLLDGHCEDLLGDSSLRHSLRDAHFDLALVDLGLNECGLALAHSLSLPTVGYWASFLTSLERQLTTASYMPGLPAFMSRLSHNMTFTESCKNTVMKLYWYLSFKFHAWYTTSLINQHIPTSPSTEFLLGDLSGVLIHSDNVLDYPRPLPPSFINVGGLQIQSPSAQLPPNLQTFLDESGHAGAVVFTMGFTFNPKIITQDRLDTLMSAFARLEQRVVVKFDSSNLGSVPSNVLVVPWVPQQAVLAHPNTKLFFTHCGLKGVQEAIHFGVPMVGMPIFMDQGDVLARMEEKGIAIGLDKFASSEEIYSAMNTVLTDPSYKLNVMALSRLVRTRRSSPMEDALWLLNYVAETKGAQHLKLATRKLSLFQFYCLDCLLFIAAMVVAIWWTFLRIVKLPFVNGGGRKQKVD